MLKELDLPATIELETGVCIQRLRPGTLLVFFDDDHDGISPGAWPLARAPLYRVLGHPGTPVISESYMPIFTSFRPSRQSTVSAGNPLPVSRLYICSRSGARCDRTGLFSHDENTLAFHLTTQRSGAGRWVGQK